MLQPVKTLPADFPASILVVLHVAPNSPTMLPQLLDSVSMLKVKHPQDGELIEAGVMYIAPPDHDLLLNGNQVLVTRGPKENRFRPSIDALFRSVAYAYGPHVIGVVLTGYLNDGSAGLWWVQQLGGLVIVQDPRDAEQPTMPAHALTVVAADYIVPLAQLGPLLVYLTTPDESL
ncbi:chemotaxis protein CheB [Hymenobacter sp. PAMC 26628]|uniref:chemotaxis protein CheB n=1 Tax=Hymenobacter sp. PAMC 26628 TaxID=1484118 RepID=UPI001F205636|nr:chemotaxis protein CheB [Hymenobacter sp. PAMC 26628]